jgi:hypothetical protein
VLAVELLVQNDLARTRPVVAPERDMARILGPDERRAGGVARNRRFVPGKLYIAERGDRTLIIRDGVVAG